MNSEKDYTHTSWLAAAALIAVLVAVSFIPPATIGGVKLRRANILSDLVRFDDAPSADDAQASSLFDEAEFHVDMAEVTQRIEADTAPRRVQVAFDWQTADFAIPGRNTDSIAPTEKRLIEELTPIEDFSADGAFGTFCDTLLAARRPVRIAVLGDSFIEGDILTADLREQLQAYYGGGGPGFAPVSSPLTAFRRTVRTQSKGWTAYNIMQRKSAPQALRSNFSVSGWVCQPQGEASTRWETTDFRRGAEKCTVGRIYFLSPHDSRIEVVVNDSLRRTFPVEGDAAVRQIAVRAERIHSLGFRLLGASQGFIGYGAQLESDGVGVDNFSVRSNNGQAMFWTNPSINAQISALSGYDLVILQYGLNIMQAGVLAYSDYGRQVEKMVAYVRECFPGATVLVLGVSDRSMKTDAGFVEMDAVPYMLECQRHAAEQTGAAFWPTADAMRTMGGMKHFVESGWAGKDYTHINYAGGRRVAWALFDAINAAAWDAYDRMCIERQQLVHKSVIDTSQLRRIEKRLLPGIVVDSNILRK